MALPSRRRVIRSAVACTTSSALTGEARGAVSLPFFVCFQVEPAAEGTDAYLSLAKELRPELDRISGFVSIERSRAVEGANGLLSLSYWADEAALVAWRSHGDHRRAQEVGHNELFADYRLRVGKVIRRWGPGVKVMVEPLLPHNRPPFHERSFMGIVRIEGPPGQVTGFKSLISDRLKGAAVYQSLSSRNRTIVVTGLANAGAGLALEKDLARASEKLRGSSPVGVTYETCEIERDYGRFDRAQTATVREREAVSRTQRSCTGSKGAEQ